MTTKTKFRLIETDDEVTIILEDGGVACIRQAEPVEGLYPSRQSTADYYQSRISSPEFKFHMEDSPDSNIWEFLAEGKMYCDDWDIPFDSIRPFREALDWLGYDIQECVRDDSIFTEIDF